MVSPDVVVMTMTVVGAVCFLFGVFMTYALLIALPERLRRLSERRRAVEVSVEEPTIPIATAALQAKRDAFRSAHLMKCIDGSECECGEDPCEC